MSSMQDVHGRVATIAESFKSEQLARGQRTRLDPKDFERLAGAGFLRLGLPAEEGGLWAGLQQSAAPYAQLIASLAMGDPSVALVASMHPIVLCYWLVRDRDETDEVRAQTKAVFDSVRAGHWWGTITSEPGSGGDINRTNAVAEPLGDLRYTLSGEKHFGSGAGIMSFMTTTGKHSGSGEVMTLFADLRGVDFDGRQGVTLARAWDGNGMSATQSHALTFERYPVTRVASPSAMTRSQVMMPLMGCLFAAVAVGIVRSAMAWSRRRVRRAEPRAYEQSEWVRAETDAWLIEQAFAGVLRTMSDAPTVTRANVTGAPAEAALAALHGKYAIAELSEQLFGRLARVVGGSALSRSQPLSQWAQDIRALGYLRPPWGLMVDQLAQLLASRNAEASP